jgi:hypothetical protein
MASEAYGSSIDISADGTEITISDELNANNIHYLTNILMHSKCQLTKLDLFKCNIGAEGAIALAPAL